MIIGVTGTLAAGKGTVADFFKNKGFKHYSVRAYLIEGIEKRKMPVNRDSMVSVANDLRALHGPSFIVEELYNRANKEGNRAIIESLRAPGEIESLKKRGGFFLIAVDADPKIRFERISRRGSVTDDVGFEKFVQDEKREMESTDPNKQNLSKCIEMADFKIDNSGTIWELNRKLENIFDELKKYLRPHWNEYFMKMAALVAERSACIRHNIGAIIVKDKRILTTGYNSAAKNTPHCIEVGCLRDELGIKSGTRHEICRAIHAEQNAIIQAGVHGINIEGGKMYSTHTPCMICAKMIVNAGIKEVISYHDYADENARKFLVDAGVKLRKVSRPVSEIKFKD